LLTEIRKLSVVTLSLLKLGLRRGIDPFELKSLGLRCEKSTAVELAQTCAIIFSAAINEIKEQQEQAAINTINGAIEKDFVFTKELYLSAIDGLYFIYRTDLTKAQIGAIKQRLAALFGNTFGNNWLAP
jgi:hypothetical protein